MHGRAVTNIIHIQDPTDMWFLSFWLFIVALCSLCCLLFKIPALFIHPERAEQRWRPFLRLVYSITFVTFNVIHA
jgi:hypothetical protein